jgi:hypothetical protein
MEKNVPRSGRLADGRFFLGELRLLFDNIEEYGLQIPTG